MATAYAVAGSEKTAMLGRGGDMFYVFIFDFALIGLLFCCAVFLVWRWIGFIENRKPHPIYRQSTPDRRKGTMHEQTKRYAQHSGHVGRV